MTKQTNHIFKLLWAILLIFFLHPTILFADEPSPFGSTKDVSGNFGSLLYVFLVLLIIIGLIVILIKFLANKNKVWMANRSIKRLSGVHLGQNKSLQVVEIGHTIYIIGVGDNVELIEKIEQADEINYIKESLYSPNSVIGQEKLIFLNNWFIRLKNKLKNRENKISEDDTPPSFQEVFNNKMKQVSIRKKRVEELLSEEYSKDRSSDQ